MDNSTIVSNTAGLLAYTPNSYVNLLYSIDNCPNGIKISFAQKAYWLNGNNQSTSITATVSGNSLSFTTSSLNYPNVPCTCNWSTRVFYAITSITDY